MPEEKDMNNTSENNESTPKKAVKKKVLVKTKNNIKKMWIYHLMGLEDRLEYML